ncbi:MAG: UDP-N-acetylglucosamine 2-epimerase (non-hydrolyzing) [Lachnospiraceae bacterium]|nr:UDP-N-acetylglucosamine 2-epimerase (non-hydrolyzing) [Lachnospiraceae bacterium]
MKVIVIFGTRPEAIKMCPLILQLKKTKQIECVVCLTGQHREMLNQVMDIFAIHADYNLDIMRQNQTLSSITIDIVSRLGDILEMEKPDLILVHGDTTTSFVAALVGFYQNIPIGHVEAGLRTYNMYSPYPEEFNRQAVDLVTALYFAPTEQSRQNLLKEGKKIENIYVTGNTVIDALSLTVRDDYQNENLNWCDGSRLILLTAHRRENLGEPMKHMFCAIKRIIEEHSDVKVIYPIHKNLKVRKIAQEVLAGVDRIRLIEPLDVMDFHNFMARSYVILTDSGGIQEEAPSLGKPVLVMRDTTERPEGIAAGTLKLVGTAEETIYCEIKKLLIDNVLYKSMSKAVNPYGDGHASERIVQAILKYQKEREE